MNISRLTKIIAYIYILISVNLFAAAPGISLSPITITEGSSGVMTITLDTPARVGGEIVIVTVKDGTTDSTDYSYPNHVFIAEGETSGYLVITANLDGSTEGIETLQIGASINHVLNAAFEDGANDFTPLSGNWEASNPYQFEANDENTYFGNGSSNGVIEIDSESQGYQDLTINPGFEYTVGFKAARRDNSRTINNIDLKVSILEVANPSNIIGELEIHRNNTDDTFEDFTFTIPATNTVTNIRLKFTTDLLNRLLTEDDGDDSKTFGMILDNLTISLSTAGDLTNADAVTTVTITESLPSVGFNFSGNQTNNELATNYAAGKHLQDNWNNITTNNASGTNLNDSSGTPTTIDIALSGFQWGETITQNGSTAGRELFKGLYDTDNNSKVSITEIPYDSYDVFVYIGSKNDGYGQIQATGSTENYYSKFGNDQAFTEFTVSTNTTGPSSDSALSNTVHFKGLTSSSLDIDLLKESRKKTDIGIHGIQIVKTPKVIAVADNYIIDKNQSIIIPAIDGVLSNDLNAASATLDLDVSQGTLALQPDGSFTYTPPLDYVGEVQFTYRAVRADGLYHTEPIQVSIAVGLPTIANPDTYGCPKNGVLRPDFPGVLSNDQSANEAELITDPSHGVLEFFNTDGTFKYIPDLDYLGSDSFTYKAKNGTEESPFTTVSIEVVDAAATSVGINFHEAGAGEMTPTESAGFSKQKNWNNISTIDAVYNNMKDFANLPTNITVETMNFTATNSGAETFATGVNEGNDDEKLFKGLFKTAQNGWKDYIEVSGIPYENYEVYVYVGSDNSGYGDIKVTGKNTFYNRFGNDDPFQSYNISVDKTGPAKNAQTMNTIHFTGLTASSFIVSLNKVKNRLGIHGIQIVKEIPTPVVGFNSTFNKEELVWNIDSEVGVKEYQIYLNGRYHDTVMATGKNSYSYLLPEGVEQVDIKAVDFDGYFQMFNVSSDQSLKTSYSIKKGWNLISIVGDHADLSALKKQGTIWTWDGANYQQAEQVEAYQGIWIKSDFSTNVIISSQKTNTDASLKIGWNLIGPSTNVMAPEGKTIYSWGEDNNYILNTHNILLQGVGYWIFSTIEKDINLN